MNEIDPGTIRVARIGMSQLSWATRGPDRTVMTQTHDGEMATPEDGNAAPPDEESLYHRWKPVFHRRRPGEAAAPKWIEAVSAVLLSITVILTAWSAFESSKWGGAMSISFSQASGARIQASQAATQAGQDRQADLSVYSLWLQAKALGTPAEVAYVQARFPDRLRVAFDEWVRLGGVSDPENAPTSPFALKSYVAPGTAQAAALSAKAESDYQTALVNNQRSDNYTILGVLFAVVLFFGAMATKFTNVGFQVSQISFAGVVLIVGIVFLVSMPKLI